MVGEKKSENGGIVTKILEPKSVVQAAKILDKKKPNWFRKVNLKRLDMLSPWNCILGQLYGDFTDGLFALGIDLTALFVYYEDEWISEINKRRRRATTKSNKRKSSRLALGRV